MHLKLLQHLKRVAERKKKRLSRDINSSIIAYYYESQGKQVIMFVYLNSNILIFCSKVYEEKKKCFIIILYIPAVYSVLVEIQSSSKRLSSNCKKILILFSKLKSLEFDAEGIFLLFNRFFLAISTYLSIVAWYIFLCAVVISSVLESHKLEGNKISHVSDKYNKKKR